MFGQGKAGTWVREMETFSLNWSLEPRVSVGMGGGQVCYVYWEGREEPVKVPAAEGALWTASRTG